MHGGVLGISCVFGVHLLWNKIAKLALARPMYGVSGKTHATTVSTHAMTRTNFINNFQRLCDIPGDYTTSVLSRCSNRDLNWLHKLAIQIDTSLNISNWKISTGHEMSHSTSSLHSGAPA